LPCAEAVAGKFRRVLSSDSCAARPQQKRPRGDRGSCSPCDCDTQRRARPPRYRLRGIRQCRTGVAHLVWAVSQTNGIGATQQRVGEPPETDASRKLLRASAGSARLICLDADRRSRRSITINFRSVTFVKQPPSNPGANSAGASVTARRGEAGVGRGRADGLYTPVGRAPPLHKEMSPTEQAASRLAALTLLGRGSRPASGSGVSAAGAAGAVAAWACQPLLCE